MWWQSAPCKMRREMFSIFSRVYVWWQVPHVTHHAEVTCRTCLHSGLWVPSCFYMFLCFASLQLIFHPPKPGQLPDQIRLRRISDPFGRISVVGSDSSGTVGMVGMVGMVVIAGAQPVTNNSWNSLYSVVACRTKKSHLKAGGGGGGDGGGPSSSSPPPPPPPPPPLLQRTFQAAWFGTSVDC